jgi:hypothetical protein
MDSLSEISQRTLSSDPPDLDTFLHEMKQASATIERVHSELSIKLNYSLSQSLSAMSNSPDWKSQVVDRTEEVMKIWSEDADRVNETDDSITLFFDFNKDKTKI